MSYPARLSRLGGIRLGSISLTSGKKKWNSVRCVAFGRNARHGSDGADLPPLRREYRGLNMDQAKRLKQLDQENTRLPRAVPAFSLGSIKLFM